jgi:hypothetical protein
MIEYWEERGIWIMIWWVERGPLDRTKRNNKFRHVGQRPGGHEAPSTKQEGVIILFLKEWPRGTCECDTENKELIQAVDFWLLRDDGAMQ